MTKEKLSLKRQLAHLVAAGTFIAANIACTISGSVNLGNKDTDSHNKALPTLTFTPTSTESPTPTVIVTRIPAPTSTPTVAEIMVATATASATASATETATSTATATENSPLPKRPNLAENKNHEGQADALGDGWSVDQYIALLNRDYAKIATGNLKDVPRDVQSDIMFSPWVAPEDVKLDHPEHFSLGLTDKALAASLAGIVEKGDEAHAHVVRVKTNNPDGSTGLENITLYEQPATDKQPALWIAGSIMTHTSEFSSTLPTSRAIIEQIVLENGKYDGNQGELAVKYLNHLGLLTSDKGRYELNPDGYLIYVAEESCQVLANPTEPLSAPLLTNHTIEDTSEGYQPLAEGKPVEWGKSDGTMQGVWQVAINKDGFDAWAAANPNATAVEREAAAETFTRAIRAEANYRADQVPAGYDKVFILNGVDYAFDKMDLFPCLNLLLASPTPPLIPVPSGTPTPPGVETPVTPATPPTQEDHTPTPTHGPGSSPTPTPYLTATRPPSTYTPSPLPSATETFVPTFTPTPRRTETPPPTNTLGATNVPQPTATKGGEAITATVVNTPNNTPRPEPSQSPVPRSTPTVFPSNTPLADIMRTGSFGEVRKYLRSLKKS